MATAALLYATSLPLAAYAEAHRYPLHYAAVIHIINGTVFTAFGLLSGTRRSITMRPRAVSLNRRAAPRSPYLLPGCDSLSRTRGATPPASEPIT